MSPKAAVPFPEANVNGFYAPQQIIPITNPHGGADMDAAFGVPWVNFGTCNPSAVPTGAPKSNELTLEDAGFEVEVAWQDIVLMIGTHDRAVIDLCSFLERTGLAALAP